MNAFEYFVSYFIIPVHSRFYLIMLSSIKILLLLETLNVEQVLFCFVFVGKVNLFHSLKIMKEPLTQSIRSILHMIVILRLQDTRIMIEGEKRVLF